MLGLADGEELREGPSDTVGRELGELLVAAETDTMGV